MILKFVTEKIINSFIDISHFFDKIDRNSKMHVAIKKSILFAMLCVWKPMVNGFKMT